MHPRYPKIKERREKLTAANRCINGPREARSPTRGVIHGEVVRGGKCQHCLDVHRRGSAAALAVECPACKAAPQVGCVTLIARGGTAKGQPTRAHNERIRRAKALRQRVNLA